MAISQAYAVVVTANDGVKHWVTSTNPLGYSTELQPGDYEGKMFLTFHRMSTAKAVAKDIRNSKTFEFTDHYQKVEVVELTVVVGSVKEVKKYSK